MILIAFLIVPVLDAITFPRSSVKTRYVKRFLNEYPYYILVSEKTRINNLLFKLLSKGNNNKRPFIYYTRLGYAVLAVLQIPIAIIMYNFCENVVIGFYLVILVWVSSIPYILFYIMYALLERKEKEYKKKKGIKIITFREALKTEKNIRAFKKRWKREKTVRKALDPYIKMTNPKKRKEFIAKGDIERVNEILKRDFPKTYTELTRDEAGNKVFCVYYRGEEDNPLIKAFVQK